MVHPRGVAIAPLELDGVAPDGMGAQHPDIGRDRLFFDHPTSRVLVNADGAGTLKAKLQVGEGKLLAGAPLEFDFGG